MLGVQSLGDLRAYIPSPVPVGIRLGGSTETNMPAPDPTIVYKEYSTVSVTWLKRSARPFHATIELRRHYLFQGYTHRNLCRNVDPYRAQEHASSARRRGLPAQDAGLST